MILTQNWPKTARDEAPLKLNTDMVSLQVKGNLHVFLQRQRIMKPNVGQHVLLRTFARKSSNIDNFIKLLLLIANQLLVSKM